MQPRSHSLIESLTNVAIGYEVGTQLEVIVSGVTYVVVEINGDAVRLENTRIMAEINVYLEDLPMMFKP